jgi:hypothetical protein
MADPADRLIAAASNANSALFISVPPTFCSGRLFARYAEIWFGSRLHER